MPLWPAMTPVAPKGLAEESGFPYPCRRFAGASAGFPTQRRGSPACMSPCLAAGDPGMLTQE